MYIYIYIVCNIYLPINIISIFKNVNMITCYRYQIIRYYVSFGNGFIKWSISILYHFFAIASNPIIVHTLFLT